MCIGAAINARVARVVFGAWDQKAGACGSVFDLPREPRLAHRHRRIRRSLREEMRRPAAAIFRGTALMRREWQLSETAPPPPPQAHSSMIAIAAHVVDVAHRLPTARVAVFGLRVPMFLFEQRQKLRARPARNPDRARLFARARAHLPDVRNRCCRRRAQTRFDPAPARAPGSSRIPA